MEDHGKRHLPPPSPNTLMESHHSNIWYVGLKLMGNGFSYVRAHELYCKNIQCVDDILGELECPLVE
jgi:hypothetical protein